MSNVLIPLLRDLLPKSRQVPAKYWYSWLRGTLEDEMSFLESLVKPGDRVIDVGGNRGVYAYRFWKLGALVEVFEPNPTCLRVLEAWAAGRPRVNVHPVALSSCGGPARLHIPVDGDGVEHDASASLEHSGFARARDEVVDLRTLDSFAFEGVGFVKIDVEGHEYSVIEGASDTLAACMPALLVEIEQRHNQRPISDVFERILGLGYAGFFHDRDRLVPIETFEPARDQSPTNFGVANARYVNNFLFLARRRIASGEYGDFLAGGIPK